MEITIREVKTRKQMRHFIGLPARIHRDHTNWVPPLYSDERQFFNARKNKSFSYSDVILLLAYRGSEVVGRIMGIINRKYNEMHGEKHARFNYLEVWDEPELTEALIGHVEDWARSRGMEKLVGPLAFSDKDPQGYLVSGFHEDVAVATHCNFEYLVRHLEGMGFQKNIDLVVYKFDIPEELPALYLKMAERARLNNPDLKLIEFTRRKDLKPWIRPIFSLINETFTDIYGFMPFTLEEMDDFANRYLLVMDPRYIKVVVREDGMAISFVIAMPDISKGIRKSRGYLFPFGFLHILRSSRTTTRLNLLLGAVHPDYQNRGLDAVMGSALLHSARRGGLDHIDSHLEMETNSRVRAQMEYMGGEVYKTYRIFAREIE